jgi:hypothetical protein
MSANVAASMAGEIVQIEEMARTWQTRTLPGLKSTQCCQVLCSSVNYCVIYNYYF